LVLGAKARAKIISVRFLALVTRRTGGVERGKQGLGGRGGSEIQPNLLWTQFFLPIAGA